MTCLKYIPNEQALEQCKIKPKKGDEVEYSVCANLANLKLSAVNLVWIRSVAARLKDGAVYLGQR